MIDCDQDDGPSSMAIVRGPKVWTWGIRPHIKTTDLVWPTFCWSCRGSFPKTTFRHAIYGTNLRSMFPSISRGLPAWVGTCNIPEKNTTWPFWIRGFIWKGNSYGTSLKTRRIWKVPIYLGIILPYLLNIIMPVNRYTKKN